MNDIANRQKVRWMGQLAGMVLVLCLVSGCATGPRLAPPDQNLQSLTPQAVQARLMEGNRRFVAGETLHRNWPAERAATAPGQKPCAVILGCMDSRAAAELVFDQGLGQLFNIRLAGNVVNDDVLGSMEYACQAAGARLIVVLGHTHCGAVKGACQETKLGHLTGLLTRLQPAVEAARQQLPAAKPAEGAFCERVAELNVELGLQQIRQHSPILAGLIDSGRVGLVGGIYDLDSGNVRFLNH